MQIVHRFRIDRFLCRNQHNLPAIITDERYRTSVDGVFAAGEIQDEIWRQVATSSGQGVSAAMSTIHWLEAHEDELQELDEAPVPAGD